MKAVLLCSVLLVGAPALADDFLTVDDAFAGSGTLDLPYPLSSAEGFTWMGPVTWDTVPFSGVGQFADGTAWSNGGASHNHNEDIDGAFMRYDIRLFLGSGADSANEELVYHKVLNPNGSFTGTIDDITITDNGHTFAGVGTPPGDDSDGDLRYLLDQSAEHFPLIDAPESLGPGYLAAVVSGLLLLRHRLKLEQKSKTSRFNEQSECAHSACSSGEGRAGAKHS